MVHPVFAAKALATVDHVSNGRAGLNIVCGWNPEEFALFGLPMIEDRYAQGLEWFEIMNRIYTAAEPFDFDGKFYQLKNVSGKPRPVQSPRPVTLNAAFSPPGRDVRRQGGRFPVHDLRRDREGPRAHRRHDGSAPRRKAARSASTPPATSCAGRRQAEAEDYYEHYAVTMADNASVDYYMPAEAEILRLARRGGLPAAPQALRRRRRHLSAGRHAAHTSPKRW